MRRRIEGMKITIEDDIPMPAAYSNNISPVTLKLLAMTIGQSFLWPHKLHTTQNVSVSLNQIRVRYGARFSYRKVPGNEIRVWRVG